MSNAGVVHGAAPSMFTKNINGTGKGERMGYDMYVEQTTPAYTEARAAWEQSLRDDSVSEEERHELFQRYQDAERADQAYFRANVWAMSSLRNLMEEAGMLYWEAENAPNEFPSPEQFGIELSDQGFYDDSNRDDDPRWQEYEKACNAVRDFDTGEGGMPGWKFGSNDGWLVTPAEIRGALQALEENGPPSFSVVEDTADVGWVQYWKQWVEFLRAAVDRGGFRVW